MTCIVSTVFFIAVLDISRFTFCKVDYGAKTSRCVISLCCNCGQKISRRESYGIVKWVVFDPDPVCSDYYISNLMRSSTVIVAILKTSSKWFAVAIEPPVFITRFNKIEQDCHPRSTSDGSRQGS